MKFKDMISKKENRTLVSFKIDKDLLIKVKNQLEIDNITMTSIIEVALRLYIEDTKNEKNTYKTKIASLKSN